MTLGIKFCPGCKAVKGVGEFHANKSSHDGLQSYCKPCLLEKNSIYGKSHKSERAAYYAEWADKNRDKVNANRRASRLRNPEGSRAACRAWAKRNSHVMAAHAANRRAFIKNATPIWVDRTAIAEIYEAASHISDISGVSHAVDHIYPLTHSDFSGLHVPWNLQVLTASENCRKGNRLCP